MGDMSLQDEIVKEKPSRKTIKLLMKSTFIGRRQWIKSDSPLVGEVLEVFPEIKKTKYVSLQSVYEFHQY